MITIVCARSKKNDSLYYALKNEKGFIITFDVMLMCSICGCSPRDVYLLNEGESINYSIERS